MKIRLPSSHNLAAVFSILAAALILAPLVLIDGPWPENLRDYLESGGVVETGARNLVSAIYLGYRAYDTLGETIVLLIAVSGAIGIVAGAGGALASGYPDAVRDDADDGSTDPAPEARRSRRRTDLIGVVTGKLGPIVLVFGLYVMLFGHVSPGGGFQGGVVVASGIVFLALGGKATSGSRLAMTRNLARMETAAFAALVAGAALGMFGGGGFLGNPWPSASPVGYIIVLNTVIGLKVGAGISFMCVAMLGEASR